LPVEIFEGHETGDTVKVFGRIALVGAFNRRELANRPINCLVGQIFGCGTAAAIEDGDQPPADGFIVRLA
jgi:hypothetical protein